MDGWALRVDMLLPGGIVAAAGENDIDSKSNIKQCNGRWSRGRTPFHVDGRWSLYDRYGVEIKDRRGQILRRAKIMYSLLQTDFNERQMLLSEVVGRR